MLNPEQFHTAELLYSTTGSSSWEPLKKGSGYDHLAMNAYVDMLLARGAEFEVRRNSKHVLLIKSDIAKRGELSCEKPKTKAAV